MKLYYQKNMLQYSEKKIQVRLLCQASLKISIGKLLIYLPILDWNQLLIRTYANWNFRTPKSLKKKIKRISGLILISPIPVRRIKKNHMLL